MRIYDGLEKEHRRVYAFMSWYPPQNNTNPHKLRNVTKLRHTYSFFGFYKDLRWFGKGNIEGSMHVCPGILHKTTKILIN